MSFSTNFSTVSPGSEVSTLRSVMRNFLLSVDEKHSQEVSVWADYAPTMAGSIIYLFVVPFFCMVGIVTNSINIWIFSRPRIRSIACSAYCYFKAISVLDLISCVLLFFSCFARTIFLTRLPWLIYDIMIYIPVGSVLSNASNVLTCAVSLDRLVYIKNCMPRNAPKMCQLHVARWVVFAVVLVSLVINLPYFFIFEIKGGEIRTTSFFYTRKYLVFNSIKLGILLVSIIFLVVSNVLLIGLIKRWAKARVCNKPLHFEAITDRKKMIKQTHLTMTLIMLVMLFVIGEVPMFFSSRTIQTGLVFPEAASARAQEIFHMVATVLNSLHISLNIIIYAWLNPPYVAELARATHSFNILSRRQELLSSDGYPHKVGIALQHSTLAAWTVMPNSQHVDEKEIRLVGYNWAAGHIFTMATTAATLNGCTGSGNVPGTHYATTLPGLRYK